MLIVMLVLGLVLMMVSHLGLTRNLRWIIMIIFLIFWMKESLWVHFYTNSSNRIMELYLISLILEVQLIMGLEEVLVEALVYPLVSSLTLMMVEKLKMEMIEKLDYKLEANFVPEKVALLVKISKLESMWKLTTM